MTKKDMVRAIAEAAAIPQGQALEIVQQVFDEIIETLVEAKRVSQSGKVPRQH